MINKISNTFFDQIIKLNKWAQKHVFYEVLHKTLIVIFPFVLVGSFSKFLQENIIKPNGFIHSIYNLGDIFSNHPSIGMILSVITMYTIQFIAPIAAFSSAQATAKRYNRDSIFAGLIGLIAYLLMVSKINQKGQIIFHNDFLGPGAFLIGILFGYFVGIIFRYTGAENVRVDEEYTSMLLRKVRAVFKPFAIIIITVIIINILIGRLGLANWQNELGNYLASSVVKNKNILDTILFTGVTVVLAFLGLDKLDYNSLLNNDVTVQNLNYALSHHSAWGAPHPFSFSTLYYSFGTIGGTGAVLCLILAALWVKKDPNFKKIAGLAVIPDIFGNNAIVLTGFPVMFNFIFIIPFIMVPLVNIAIGAIAIWLGIIPAPVYPLPVGTPGLIAAYIGTDGNLGALIVSLINLTVGTIMYIPFVKRASDHKYQEKLEG